MTGGQRRCFLALPLSELFAEEAGAFLNRAEPRLPGVRWVAPQLIHATLHFFGTVTEGEIAVIERTAREAAQRETPMTFSIGGIGFFPGPDNIRVIWAGLQGDMERLHGFQAKLVKALAEKGFPVEERAFNPHVTLGRARGRSRRIEFPAALDFIQTEPKRIEEIVLYESQTLERAKTPSYSPFLTFPLAGNQST